MLMDLLRLCGRRPAQSSSRCSATRISFQKRFSDSNALLQAVGMPKTKRKPAWKKPKAITPEAQAERDEQSRLARDAHLKRLASAEFTDAVREEAAMAIEAIADKLMEAVGAQWAAAQACEAGSTERERHDAARRALLWARDVMIYEDLNEAPPWRPDEVGQSYSPSEAWLDTLGPLDQTGASNRVLASLQNPSRDDGPPE